MGVLQQEKAVELSAAGQPGPLRGFLTAMDARTLRLRLEKPFDAEALRPGISVYVLMTVKDVAYRTPACLTTIDGANVYLTLVQTNQYEERSCPRRRCEIPVRFRAIHGGGCQGAWRHGVTADLSVEGMGLIVDTDTTIQERLEVWFCLEDMREPMRAPGRAYNDDGGAFVVHTTDSNVVRVQAKAVRCKPLEDGTVLIGLNFQTLMPKDRARLARYVSAGLDD